MQQQMINTDVERSALALFTRMDMDEMYKRTVLYLVYKTVKHNRSMQLSRLIFELERKYDLNREDVRCAVGALKSPATFAALSVYVPACGAYKNRVCRTCDNPAINNWVAEIEHSYPHISRLIQ